MPKRIQRKRTKGWKKPEGSVVVSRGTRWGNPFVVGRDGTASECIRKYKEELFPYRHNGGTMDELFTSVANLEEIQDTLRGKDLACWCSLDEPCHADLLLVIANW
jgi:hypothetical protein